MNIPLEAMSTREGYLDWLSLASHEYFHAWNGKRLRPVELGPFDYENEIYTRALWFVEGFTDYYADLFVVRAASPRATSTSTPFRCRSGRCIRLRAGSNNRSRPPRTMRGSSTTARTKTRPNTAISYYVKGAVIGFLLDARIRHLTDGRKSLDDVMREMYMRFSGEKGFSREELRSAVAEIVGPAHARDIHAWMTRALETTNELDYTDAMAWLGLHMTPPPAAPRAYLGVTTRTTKPAKPSSPAFDAGRRPQRRACRCWMRSRRSTASRFRQGS